MSFSFSRFAPSPPFYLRPRPPFAAAAFPRSSFSFNPLPKRHATLRRAEIHRNLPLAPARFFPSCRLFCVDAEAAIRRRSPLATPRKSRIFARLSQIRW